MRGSSLPALLHREDPELWRWLMPCDPVITVADDVVFFECFSADESSYGCLTVSRDASAPARDVSLGTTNVDYSWDLYNHFQSLRTYRQTRFLIDPAGFEVKTEAAPGYREEKIDLPAGWLRGFMTTQEAMGMPGLTVQLSREAVYSILGVSEATQGEDQPAGRPVRAAARQAARRSCSNRGSSESSRTARSTTARPPSRSASGARGGCWCSRGCLPLAERFDVTLLGTGLPSFWVAHMGEMQLTLGLSGWTTNDWTRGSALDLLAPPATITEDLLLDGRPRCCRNSASMSLAQVCSATAAQPPAVTAALRRLAFAGQVIHDLPQRRLSLPPGDADAARRGAARTGKPGAHCRARSCCCMERPRLESTQHNRTRHGADGQGRATPVEIMVDLDGRIRRGKCVCGHFRKYGIRNGPCRHMIVLRYRRHSTSPPAATVRSQTDLTPWHRNATRYRPREPLRNCMSNGYIHQ